jgi:hypothetical protein
MSGTIGIRFFAGIADMGTLHVARHPATCMLSLEVAVWSILLSFRERNTTTKRAPGDALPGARNTQLARYRGAFLRDEGRQSNASTSAIVPAPAPVPRIGQEAAIRYINRPYSHSTLAGLYRAARVGLVTPLRDGMNLVAKEYIASQNPEDPGVLILSRFAGAAHECKAALLVNPYDPDSVAAAIGQALSMALAERRDRYDSLFKVLSHNDIQHWADRFLAALDQEPRALSELEQMPS